MKGINEYKRRFNMLLESKMGDVKPLISEAPQFEEFVVPTLDMMKVSDVFSSGEATSTENELDFRYGNRISHEKSLVGEEYKLTLPEGMYEASEIVFVGLTMDPILKLTDEIKKIASDNVFSAEAIKRENDDTRIIFKFRMPETQKELKDNSPFITYVDFRCKNVKGGKIKFTVEVPSGSEIFEKEKPVPTPTPNNNFIPSY